MIDDIVKDAEERMQKSIASLEESFKKIRTGRAPPSILDSVMVSEEAGLFYQYYKIINGQESREIFYNFEEK